MFEFLRFCATSDRGDVMHDRCEATLCAGLSPPIIAVNPTHNNNANNAGAIIIMDSGRPRFSLIATTQPLNTQTDIISPLRAPSAFFTRHTTQPDTPL